LKRGSQEKNGSHRYIFEALGVIVAVMLFQPVCAAQDGGCGDVRDDGKRRGDTDSLHLSPKVQLDLEWYSMFTNIPGDYARYTRVTFRSEKFPSFIGMTVLTGGLMLTDQKIWEMSDRWYRGSQPVKSMSDFFEYLGDGRPQFGLAAGFAAFGFITSDHRALRTGSQIVEAILSCGIVVQVMKHTTGRESPDVATRNGGRWVFFPNQIEYHKHVPHYDAYPSGHIATALATVTVVAENYPEWKWVIPIGYPIVALIGIAMGNTGIHWYSDYPLGLALGYSFGMLAAHPEGLPEESEEYGIATRLTVSPMISALGNGMTVTFSF
jgi:membrane-associated PAP2 superfamily phosphatase